MQRLRDASNPAHGKLLKSNPLSNGLRKHCWPALQLFTRHANILTDGSSANRCDTQEWQERLHGQPAAPMGGVRTCNLWPADVQKTPSGLSPHPSFLGRVGGFVQ